ncbi:MAG: UDP-glucose/GDP-mannose dehydrogenase family protein [Parcubacteria group bacterium]|jgi:UDPglucose 6-dehydrogenase
MKIVMIGAGYVGLVTGACFAEFGHDVKCVDTDEDKIAQILRGEMPIFEPGLEDLVKKNIAQKRLGFVTDMALVVPEADAVFIAVGTPSSRRGDGHADLSYVYDAARNIAKYLQGYTVVVNKSTVPVGTAVQVKRIIGEVAPQVRCDVASNPEFLREGAAIKDFMHPDRIVIGVDSDQAEQYLRMVYKPINLTETPLSVVDIATAEMIKYSANAFLAVKVSFINEIARLCDEVGADVVKVAKGIGMDRRIGKKFLHPGPGYGGSCFPKDAKALCAIAQEHGVPLRIVGAAIEANNSQKALMVKKIRDALGGSEAGKRIAILGLAFKPDTDDMRDAPVLTIIPALVEKGAIIYAHDPQAMIEAKKYLPWEVEYYPDPYETCRGAHAVVIMTEWNEFRALDLERLRLSMEPDPVFIDLRNVYVPNDVRMYDFRYVGVGRN